MSLSFLSHCFVLSINQPLFGIKVKKKKERKWRMNKGSGASCRRFKQFLRQFRSQARLSRHSNTEMVFQKQNNQQLVKVLRSTRSSGPPLEPIPFKKWTVPKSFKEIQKILKDFYIRFKTFSHMTSRTKFPSVEEVGRLLRKIVVLKGCLVSVRP